MQKRISYAEDWLYDESGNSEEIAPSSKNFQSVKFFCRPRLKISFQFMQTHRNSDCSSPENISSPHHLAVRGSSPTKLDLLRFDAQIVVYPIHIRRSVQRVVRLVRACVFAGQPEGTLKSSKGKCSMPVSDGADQFRPACTLSQGGP
jgi:hypothetical protein